MRDNSAGGPIRATVLGSGRFCAEIIEILETSGMFEIEAVLPSIPEPVWMESLSQIAKQKGWPLIESGKVSDIPGEAGNSLALSVNYAQILTRAEISRFKRVLNLHNAPLPRYRGCNPINWALFNGETSHGVTLHVVDEGIDTGGILDQITFPISPITDEVIDVYRKCLDAGKELITRNLANFMTKVASSTQKDDKTFHLRSDAKNLGDRSSWVRSDPYFQSPKF